MSNQVPNSQALYTDVRHFLRKENYTLFIDPFFNIPLCHLNKTTPYHTLLRAARTSWRGSWRTTWSTCWRLGWAFSSLVPHIKSINWVIKCVNCIYFSLLKLIFTIFSTNEITCISIFRNPGDALLPLPLLCSQEDWWSQGLKMFSTNQDQVVIELYRNQNGII